jgi:hypothetical protein
MPAVNSLSGTGTKRRLLDSLPSPPLLLLRWRRGGSSNSSGGCPGFGYDSQTRKKALGIGKTPSKPGSCMFIHDSSPLSSSSSGITAKVRLWKMLNAGRKDMLGLLALP